MAEYGNGMTTESSLIVVQSLSMSAGLYLGHERKSTTHTASNRRHLNGDLRKRIKIGLIERTNPLDSVRQHDRD